MMEEQIGQSLEERALALIEGAAQLVDVYGYWPSFHDAQVETVVIERRGPTVTIHFITNDQVDKDGVQERDKLAQVTIRWHEVKDLSLNGIDWEENNWIDGLTVRRDGDDVRTVIDPMDGFHGFIVAGRIEVLDVQPIPSPRG
jgi:hypothetical protein